MSAPIRIYDISLGRCPLLGPALYVWVQGCDKHCRGCINSEAREMDSVCDLMSPEQIAARFEALPINLVLSGGEPFLQSRGLSRLCSMVRRIRSETRILCYTGYTLDELLKDRTRQSVAFLRQIDVLVDGPFIESRLTDDPLIGSDNQRIILFSNRVSEKEVKRVRRPSIQIQWTAERRIRLVGTGMARVGMQQLVDCLESNRLIFKGDVDNA